LTDTDKQNTKQENTQTKYNPEKKSKHKTAKQNNPGSVASYDTRPRNEMGLFYNAPKLTWGIRIEEEIQEVRWILLQP